MAVRLTFSLDSSDCIATATNAKKWWAKIMSKDSITACICVAGEVVTWLLKQLQTNRSLPASIPLSEVPELPKAQTSQDFATTVSKPLGLFSHLSFVGLRTLEHAQLQKWTVSNSNAKLEMSRQ